MPHIHDRPCGASCPANEVGHALACPRLFPRGRNVAKYLVPMRNYSATQNNGRITSSNDYVTTENVTYTYDALNRLTGASAGSMWGETYSYDGFGNLTGKNVTQPQAPTLGVSYDADNHEVGMTYDANGRPIGGGERRTATTGLGT